MLKFHLVRCKKLENKYCLRFVMILFELNYKDISKLLIQNITLKCNFPSNIILIKYTNLHENITRQVFLIKSWLANLRHALNDLMEQTKCTFCNLLQGFEIWKFLFSRDKKSLKTNVSIQSECKKVAVTLIN